MSNADTKIRRIRSRASAGREVHVPTVKTPLRFDAEGLSQPLDEETHAAVLRIPGYEDAPEKP